jgi:HD-GYP domain-containing protein (c-di-GMP phosphodiesterase class II)
MKSLTGLFESETLSCDISQCTSSCFTIQQFAESLSKAVDAKDGYTYAHSQETAVISYFLALGIGVKPKQADFIHFAGLLHDLGKIGVSEDILRKHGKLTLEEWKIIKRHPVIGADILRPVKAFNTKGCIADMVLYHHERYDGSGYPYGLKGKDIPLGARIIAVADAFSALINNRPYRKGASFEDAIEVILRCSGTQFDPNVVFVMAEGQDKMKTWLEGI